MPQSAQRGTAPAVRRHTVRRRIEWVDAAKGLCMLFVIAAHTLPYESLLRSFLMSFLMPAFFFLSGYTARRPKSWSALARRIGRDFRSLLVPVFGVVMVLNVILSFLLSDEKSFAVLGEIFVYNLQTLFWASGNATDTIPSCGMPWFLFALFWGKLIWGLIGLVFPKGDAAVCFLVALIGAYVGQVQYLPQCLDLAMLSVLYLMLGHLFHRYQKLLDLFRLPVFLAAAVPWALCCQQGHYLEFASRTYDNFILGALGSVCGIWVLCELCRELIANPLLCRALVYLGRNSLWLFFVHHMDLYAISLWQSDSTALSVLFRYVWDLSLTVVLLCLRAYFRPAMRRARPGAAARQDGSASPRRPRSVVFGGKV